MVRLIVLASLLCSQDLLMSLPIVRSRLPTTLSQVTRTATRLTLLNSHFAKAPVPALRPFTTTTKMSSLPSTMKAVLVTAAGGSDKLEYTDSQPLPKLQDGQILVKNEYAGINYIDTYFRTGLYPAPNGYPLILGQEAVGTVAAVQGTSSFKEGDKVVWLGQGGYGEYKAVPANRAVKLPSGMDEKDAVSGFLMGMTALSLTKEAYEVKKGDKVLLHAAAGGMGLILCQVLKGIGAYTIGTAGSAEKCKLAEEYGADVTINYTENKQWPDKVKELTNGEGVNVVYDSVGKTTWEGSLQAVKRKGKGMYTTALPEIVLTSAVVYWGNASGPVPPLQISQLAAKNTSIMRATLMQYIVTEEEFKYYANMAISNIKDGKIKIKIHKVYDLKDAKQAHDDVEGRGTTGKLLLKL